MKYKENQLPVNSLKELGLHDGTKDLLPSDIKEQLLKGSLTDFVQLKNIPVNGESISIDAKLSLREKPDGSPSLLIHPIYNKRKDHPLLTSEENDLFQKEGVHSKKVSAYGTLVEHGSARYEFQEKGQPSYYVRLAKPNGDTFDIWGKDLQRALTESKQDIGDKIQLNFKGSEPVKVEVPQYNEDGAKIGTKTVDTVRNSWEVAPFEEKNKQEKTYLFEFDEETKSFVGIDQDSIIVPETINGMKLSPEQQREFKDGKLVTLPDDTQIQASPVAKDNVKSNRRLLVASLLLDGGISYLLIMIAKGIAKKATENKAIEKEYARGYLEALNKIKGDLQKKQGAYPDNKEIARDLNIVGKEISSVTTLHPTAVTLENKNVNEIKSKVNDPELDDNALRVEKTEEHHAKEVKQQSESEEQSTSTGYKR